MPYRLLRMLVLCLALLGSAEAATVRIGAEDDWYPYTALRDGQIKGMSADIVRAAFKASGTDFELVPYPYSRCMELARNGGLAGCFNTTPDHSIRQQFLLPEEMLFSDDILLWGRAGTAAVNDLDDIAGRRVAVTIGYTYGEYFDNYPDLLRIPVRRDINSFLMLQRNRVDYVIAFRGTTEALLREHPELAGQFAPLATIHRPQLYLTFSRLYPQATELAHQFDAGMRQIRHNGTYQRILEHWQLRTGQTSPLGYTLQGRHNNKTESP
ncbi:ABC transporter permease [Pseudomonas sp. 8Z]|uniref:substrate-binding periplasmic protein n=1 Tax=Pseudomonas sp. 8Z TaxID=2653166 RepID=UPI0012F3D1E9|nr:transporter substrate-binding domain-containing protein [Pseudomonas sp. 8Z]VXC85058.1 ABC transporter permease [Pseudomonas sp. 8Z]